MRREVDVGQGAAEAPSSERRAGELGHDDETRHEYVMTLRAASIKSNIW